MIKIGNQKKKLWAIKNVVWKEDFFTFWVG